MSPAWLVPRRSGNGTPSVYHLSDACATRRRRFRPGRVPRQVTLAAARKVARPCGLCAREPW